MTMTRLWNVIGAVAVLLILLVGYAVGVSPALSSASTSDDDLVSVEAQNQVKDNELAALKALAEDSDQLFADLAEVQVAVPGTQESSEFARRISSLAATAGVALVDVSYSAITEALAPEAEVAPVAPAEGEGETATDTEGGTAEPEVGAAEPAAPTGPQVVQSVPGLVAVGVSINATGSLANVINFINSVQLNERAFSVSSSAIRTTGDSGDYDVTLEGTIYVLVANEVPIASTTDSSGTVN